MSVSQDLVPIEFERGPYGEIVPPSLAVGMPLDNLGLVYVHQRRLRQAIAGELDEAEARDLYQAVVVEGERVSLRPLGQEECVLSSFAPVLQCIEGDCWRVGVAGQGRTRDITAPPGRVVELAQGVFVEWCAAEGE